MASSDFVFDTGILLTLIRGKNLGKFLIERFNLNKIPPSSQLISIVSHAEIESIGKYKKWGEARLKNLESMLQNLITVPINDQRLVDAYVEIDNFSRTNREPSAQTMGKNDIWIAATTNVCKATLLTIDRDFEHLGGKLISRIYVD